MSWCRKFMVRCTACGIKNEDEAKHCVQCGDSLYFDEKSRPRQRSSDLCYDIDETGDKKLSQRGILIIGAIIVVIALSQISDIWFPEIESSIWPLFFLVAGIIVVLYALFFFRVLLCPGTVLAPNCSRWHYAKDQGDKKKVRKDYF